MNRRVLAPRSFYALISGLALSAALCLAAIVCVLLFLDRPVGGALDRSGTSRELPSTLSTEGDVDAADDTTTFATSVASDELEIGEGQRREEDAGGLGGVVRVAEEPIAGATVRWVELPEPDYASSYRWARESDASARLETTTDEDGQFLFPNAPGWALGTQTILWVTAPGYCAQPVEVVAYDEREGAWCEISLESPNSARVRVEEADGQPAAGAEVFLAGIYPSRSADKGAFLARAYRAYFVRGQTGPDGVWKGSPLPGLQAVWTRRGADRSSPWIGYGTKPIQLTLTLSGSFSVSGSVTLKSDRGELTDLQIHVSSLSGSQARLAQFADVDTNGGWGPLTLPANVAYEVALSGGLALPLVRQLESVEAGARLRVDFEVDWGTGVPLRVVDDHEDPIHAARVTAMWSETEGISSGAVSGYTDDDGLVVVGGCPATTLMIRVDADGFVDYENWYQLDEGDEIEVETIQLKPGGTVAVRCTHEGEPVEEYDVSYWSGHPGLNRMSETVLGAVDGRFELTGVPLGEVGIFAASKQFPRSEVKVVRVVRGEVAEVDLELPDPITGEGKVVDNVTGEPIRDARVQIYSAYRGNYFDAWGPDHTVDENGYFRIQGFAPRDTRFIAYAHGYADWLGEGFGVPGEVMDLGLISLARNQVLTIRLTSDEPEDYAGYQVAPVGNQYYPTQSFDAGGITQYPNAGPGTYAIRVDCPDSSMKFFEDYLYSGEDWTYDVPIGRGRELHVRMTARDRDAVEASGAAYAQVTYVTPAGLSIQGIRPLDDDFAAFYDDLTGVRATVEALDAEGNVLAAKVTPLGAEVTEVELPLDGSDLRIRVVDRDRNPLPGTTIRLLAPHLAVGYIHQVVTDARGEYAFRSLDVDRVFVNLSHPDHGVRSGVEVAVAETGDSPVTIELDAPARIRVRLLDGDEVLAGVQTRFFDARCEFEFGTFASDATGLVTSGPVAEGDYRVVVIHPGLWSTDETVTATTGVDETPLQIPRLGAAEFQVRTGSLPVSGANVVLVHQESASSSTDWIAQGRVGLIDAGLPITGSDGELRFEGLPRGAYQWSVEAEGFEASSGSCIVHARANERVDVALRTD